MQDAELVQVWREQLDYREDVVGWVSAEIQRRGLDVENVPVMTVEDQARREKEWDSSLIGLYRVMKWGGSGVVLLAGGLVALWEATKEGEALIIAAPSIVGGIFCLWMARGKWVSRGKEKRKRFVRYS